MQSSADALPPPRILYFGPPAAVRPQAGASNADVLARMGRNTGNLLIGDAILRQLVGAPLTRLADLLERDGHKLALAQLDTARIEQDFDVIVIGAANFLHAGFDFTPWARIVESVRLPCVILGLGAQAPDYGCRIAVPEGTTRLVKIVAERSTTVGVRGHFTAEVVDAMGVRNVRVVGCPSMYWTCQPSLRFRERSAAGPLLVSVNGSANVVEHAVDPKAARRVEGLLARLSFERGYPYVLQNEIEMMDVLLDAVRAPDASLVDALRLQYGLEDLTPRAFVEFVRKNMAVYWDTRPWFAAVSAHDLVVGTRFHGCLIAILAGVPAFVFAHDARTREMCELLRLPHQGVRSVDTVDVRALYDSLDLDATTAAHARLYQNYVTFLDENSLAHRLRRDAEPQDVLA